MALVTLIAGCTAPLNVSSSTVSPYLGVYEPESPGSYAPIETFASTIHKSPDIALYYSGWPERFQKNFAEQAHKHGATLLIQIDPTNVNMKALASGKYNSYIALYARNVGAYGRQVIIGFGHKMNGPGYTWAWGHTSPNAWVSAWRHIVQVFRKQGAKNVTWMWAITRESPSTGPIRDSWPGAGYVNWVGIDEYYYSRTDTFDSVFGPTLTAVRKLTRKPILLSEVGIGQVSGQAAKIPGLFADVREDHLLGLVWFDVDQHGSEYAQDWRLEGHKAAVEAFRRAAAH